MNIASTVARILLGIVFVGAGASGFFMKSPPPQPGLAGEFNELFFTSHWVLFIGAAQVILGALLLVNGFVPVALIMLAAFLYNSFAFHITMARSGLPAPIVATALGLIVAMKYRPLFALLLSATPKLPDEAEPLRANIRAT